MSIYERNREEKNEKEVRAGSLADVLGGFVFGCLLPLTIPAAIGIVVYNGALEIKKRAEEAKAADAAIERPVITGTIVREAVIPSDLSENAQRQYPY